MVDGACALIESDGVIGSIPEALEPEGFLDGDLLVERAVFLAAGGRGLACTARITGFVSGGVVLRVVLLLASGSHGRVRLGRTGPYHLAVMGWTPGVRMSKSEWDEREKGSRRIDDSPSLGVVLLLRW